jgi:nucleoside-diphosphate-sugar epimerase
LSGVILKKTLLITGASGYLGSHLAHRFVADGHVVGIIRRATSSLDRIVGILDKIRIFDVERVHEPFEALGRVDAVIHTATNYGRRGEPVTSVFEANSAFPLRLLEAAISNDVKMFINADTSLDSCLNAYTLSKHQFKEWGRHLARDGRYHFVNLRLEHMYGANDDPAKFSTYVVRACIGNMPELKLTKGEQFRDFIYINDVVDAYVCILNGPTMIGGDYVDIDVGSGVAATIREFAELVKIMTGASTRLNFGAIPYREHETMFGKADTSRLYAMGWESRHDLRAGLEKMIAAERSLLLLAEKSASKSEDGT